MSVLEKRGPQRSRDGRPSVLLRAGWQTSNIGDVAHIPGTLRALERWAPGLQVVLWPRELDTRESQMVRSAFPDVKIVRGHLDVNGHPTNAELESAWNSAHMLIHGPAGAVVEHDTFSSWAASGRPYGYLGVTIDPGGPWVGGTLAELNALVAALPPGHLGGQTKDLLADAAFVYLRDSISLAYTRTQIRGAEHIGYGPDATFAFDLREDALADQLLDRYGLESGSFVCVVPRTRYAPYHLLRGREPGPEDLLRQAVNTIHLDSDLGVLARVIEAIIRETGKRVLLCPEMRHAVALAEREVVHRVPSELHADLVTIPDFWNVDLAAAIYARATAVVSMECHSVILALAHDTPASYLRLPTETSKGRMFDDLGLHDVLVEIGPDAPREVMSRLDDGRVSAGRRVRANEAARVSLGAMAGRVQALLYPMGPRW